MSKHAGKKFKLITSVLSCGCDLRSQMWLLVIVVIVMRIAGFEYNINELYRIAQTRWLKPAEVMYILQNHEKYQFTEEAPQQPTSNICSCVSSVEMAITAEERDGRTVGEAHERLKVGNVEALKCYYAHGEQNPTFQRRSFWMLDPAYDHIVLVHYRETSEGKSSSGSGAQSSPGSSSAFTPSPSSYSTHNPGSTSIHGDSNEPNRSFSSPLSVEVTSDYTLGTMDWVN
ncbi:putative transcription factor CG1-CAMTA family [Lupinus albus]|uniref:Putative transcription factor CG1-CAMTA family n=1 Tax=Lupinus albus TaxID=3870 RepID=A0A6A4PHV7_LUPAL|nr:putative transcription factor CG1-CAMTA family [Lupinus albus]